MPEDSDITEIVQNLEKIIMDADDAPEDSVRFLKKELPRIVENAKNEIRIFIQEKTIEFEDGPILDSTLEHAEKLYEKVKTLSQTWDDVDDAKARDIIEYANDAIKVYGNSNQEKKTELRKIILKAEDIIPPETIELLRKRGEKTVIKSFFPRTQFKRKVLVFILGLGVLITLCIPLIGYLYSYLNGPIVTDPSVKPQIPESNHALFLVDVTSSLSVSELDKVAALSADIIEHLPDKTRVDIFPIQKNSQRLLSIYSNVKSSSGIRRNNLEKREKLIEQIVRSRDSRSGTTCILDALSALNQEIKEIKETQNSSSTDVFIISDMLENCSNSPLGNIQLTNESIDTLIAKLNFFVWSYAPDFSNVKVTIIYPLTTDSFTEEKSKPKDEKLREFWKIIFLKCNMKQEWFWDNEHVTWIQNGRIPKKLEMMIE